MKKRTQNKDYILDPKTRRAVFLKNNKAALVHGGYSKQLTDDLTDALLTNDLGYELGVLKGQLINLTSIGDKAISYFLSQGDSISALQMAISCAECSARLVPQINKLIELKPLDENRDVILKLRTRWLKKLRAGGCSASEVAYQFEVNDLGELPRYVQMQIENEIKNTEPELSPELYTREELEQKLSLYWAEVDSEQQEIEHRKKKILAEKDKFNAQYLGEQNG